MLDWNDLRTFAEVARAGSVAAAARNLRVHPTTVARRIAAAEEALGAALFLRSGRQLQVSPAGQTVLVPLAPLVDVVDDVARRAERHRDAPLRIAVTENGGRLFASHVVPRLQREGVETELLVGNAVVDLARGDADLAVRVVAPEAPELIRRRVGSVVYGLYASRAYIENAPSLVDGFRGQQVLLPAGLLATAPEATWLGMHAREARIVLRANSLVTLAHAAEADAGVVVLPVNLAFFHPRLVRLRRLDDIPGRPVWLVMHRTQQANARLRRARTVIAEALADLERRLG